jgi:hypothetical protein
MFSKGLSCARHQPKSLASMCNLIPTETLFGFFILQLNKLSHLLRVNQVVYGDRYICPQMYLILYSSLVSQEASSETKA